MQVHTETVTPQMAQEWLEHNTSNRRLSKRKVRLYADDMRKDRWSLHHQGIAFYEDGELGDGQHRLAAVIEADHPVEMVVVRGLSRKAGADIDRHRPRGEADAIRIGGIAEWIGRNEVSVIKALAGVHGTHPHTFTARQIAEIGKHVEEEVSFAVNAFPKRQRFVTTAPVMAAVAIACTHYDNDRLLEFAEVMSTGIPRGPEDVAAIRLRENLIARHGGSGGSTERKETIYKTLRAIQLFMERKEIDRIQTPKQMPLRIAELDEVV